MRTLLHPGPVQQPRIVGAVARPESDLRLVLPPGIDLLDAFRDTMLSRGITGAAALLIAGSFDHLQYLTGGPDPSGRRAATYGAPAHVTGPATLVSGNAILGTGADGAPLVHCHAVVIAPDGRLHGGHLPPGTSRLGASGAVAIVTAYAGATFQVAFDAETNYALFGPVERAA